MNNFSNDKKCIYLKYVFCCVLNLDLPQPRPNEHGGKYGQGVIVRKYNPGSDFTIRVELTASHMG